LTKKLLLIFIAGILLHLVVIGQEQEIESPSVYKINRKVEIPITLGLLVANFYGFNYLDNKPSLSDEEISQLNANDIWNFDRSATKQDVSKIYEAHDISDIALNTSVLLPTLLALDKDIRKVWFDLLILYGETHAINSGFYIATAAMFGRVRPFVYNPEVRFSDKIGRGTRNSFFSGHVSTAASASFFMAKVYSDYHPELGKKKLWLFGAALIPPIVVGYYRYKAMKHFPTDVITGLVVGSAFGIIIPELHKNKKEESKFSFIPFTGSVSGLKICYSLR